MNTGMAGFVPDRPSVQIGTIFYERTENTIVIKVIKQFFCDTHDKPKAHDHGTTMTLATDYALFCFASA
jgi:hypothetical protein